MPDESDLRTSLRRGGSAAAEIDLDAVLRRARARRRPRIVAAAAAGALLVTGVVVPIGLETLELPRPVALSSLAEGDDAGTADGAAAHELAPTDPGLVCGAPVIDPEPAANGLVLDVPQIDTTAAAEPMQVIVTLRNTGSDRVRGTVTGPPVLTLSRDGLVVWHDVAAEGSATVIDLAPGRELDFVVTFDPRVCDPDGDDGDLPAAPAGSYRLGAAVEFTDEAGSDPVVVTGPGSPVELR